MPPRVPTRLARLLAVACACLAPAAAAQAAPPPNDTASAAVKVDQLTWTSLSAPQTFAVQASDWGDATTGPEDADPLPSCAASVGFRSTWYSLLVPEAAVLRVTVVSTDTARYQPVATIARPRPERTGLRAGRHRQGRRHGQRDGLRHARGRRDPGDVPDPRRRARQQLARRRPADADGELRRQGRDAAAHRRQVPVGQGAAAEEGALRRLEDDGSRIRHRRGCGDLGVPRQAPRQDAGRAHADRADGDLPVAVVGRARRRLPRARPGGEREHLQLHDVRPGLHAAGRHVQPAPAGAGRAPAAHHP